ncbi:MAG: hypothetical protein Q9210_001278 [Variospora velana]
MMPFGPSQRRFGPYPPRRRRIEDDRSARWLPGKSAMTPAPFSWLDGKSKPGPSKEDFAVLQSIKALPAQSCLQLSMEEAYTLAEKALKDHSRGRIVCIDDNKPMTIAQKRKLPFQVFNELDAEFFRSALKGNVSVGWKELPRGVLSLTARASRKSNPRIRILLSPQLLRSGSRLDVFGALIHQMIHAYYLQCCGFRNRGNTGEGHDLEHEQAFQALLECIREHCRVLEGPLHLSDLSIPLGKSRNTSSQEPMPGASCCYGQKKRLNDIDIQNWREAAAVKTESLKEAQKSKATGSQDDSDFPKDMYYVHKEGTEDPPTTLDKWHYAREAYIFLCFDNRHYPVPRSLISDLTALTSSTHCKDKVFLQMPQGTSEGDFLTFYSFLVHGVYPPYLKALNTQSSSFDPTRQGPPKIKSYDPSAPTYLIRLITAFHLGTVLQYKPFRDFVLKGLYSLENTAEDPVAVLEQIYFRPKDVQHINTSASIDDPLRAWTRSWLATENNDPGLDQCVARSPSNLDIVRSHPRYEQRRVTSVELAQDDNAAARNIAHKHSNSSLMRIGSPVLSPVRSLLTPRPEPVPLPRRSNIPSRSIFPDDYPPTHFADSSDFRPNEGRTPLDLSGIVQNLPNEYLQYPHSSPGLPTEDLARAETYRRLMVQKSKHEANQNWIAAQLRNNPYNAFDQQGLPSLEQSRRPY